MTLRGKLTLWLLAGAAFGMLWQGLSGPFDSEATRAEGTLPPRALVGPPAPRPAPASVLVHLPPSARGAAWPEEETGPLVETLVLEGEPPRRVQLEYTLSAELSHRVQRILERGRVELGHVIVLDPYTGRVLAYAATDPARFPPTRVYPAASLMKVITAAATLQHARSWVERPCRYRGNPYRLTSTRLDPPRRGRTASLREALAMSNNQCFAQLAVHALGPNALLEEIEKLGLLEPPAPGHQAGRVELGSEPLDLGRLASGLSGGWITPLGAARLAATLATGDLVEPRWIARVTDADGAPLALPTASKPEPVLPSDVAEELRGMLVATTQNGTARRAFRDRRGRPLLDPVRVAGKTGSLTGRDPDGRYEWFIGLAPADRPRLAVATLVVHGDLYWRNATQLAAEVLQAAFCSEGECRSAPIGLVARSG